MANAAAFLGTQVVVGGGYGLVAVLHGVTLQKFDWRSGGWEIAFQGVPGDKTGITFLP